jgi:hypothetical protein
MDKQLWTYHQNRISPTSYELGLVCFDECVERLAALRSVLILNYIDN